jgi:hypothetical protein
MTLRREWQGSRLTERARQLRKEGQVGVQPHALQPTDAERCKRPLMLQAPELALDSRAAPVGCCSAASRAG